MSIDSTLYSFTSQSIHKTKRWDHRSDALFRMHATADIFDAPKPTEPTVDETRPAICPRCRKRASAGRQQTAFLLPMG
jgi:hypothetical protein